MKKTPHKHAKFIKAWADGETIEQYNRSYDVWFRVYWPSWGDLCIYRIRDVENGVCGEDEDPFELDLPGHR